MSFTNLLCRYLLSPLLPAAAPLSSSNKSSKPIPSVSSYLNAFDVDPVTGFMPSKPLPSRLPNLFDPWEEALSSAPLLLSLGDDNDEEALARRESSRLWRLQLANVQ